MVTNLDIRQSVLRVALNMAGTAANASVDTILQPNDAEMGKLFEDRNVMLTGGGTLTNSAGTALSYSSDFTLYVNSNIAGAAPYVITISAGSSPWSFSADGRMAYVVINRTAQTGVLTTNAATLPAVSFANQEVFVLAKRVGTTIYFRQGSSLANGLSGTLGNISNSGSTTFGMISNNDSAGTGGLTVATGTSLFNPYLHIVTGDTYTVSTGAQLVSVTSLAVDGTLVINGTGETRIL